MATKKRKGPEQVGLVGLGLMGRGIATCLLGHGFNVVAWNRTRSRALEARGFIAAALDEAVKRGVLRASRVRGWEKRFRVVRTCRGLADCSFVIESVREELAVKRELYALLEDALTPGSVIASNTSSFPIAVVRAATRHPERFVVMHWAEPAWVSRFMEIVRDECTCDDAVERAEGLAMACDKEPAVLEFDIRGFIANRLMYAFIREACHLAELGVADFATIDRSFRNDTGWWAALAGPFRWMDLTGIEAYGLVMKDLLPELCNDGKVPRVMKQMMKQGARGTANHKGFYAYDGKTAAAWEQAWVDFTYDMRGLVRKVESRLRKADAL